MVLISVPESFYYFLWEEKTVDKILKDLEADDEINYSSLKFDWNQ